MSFYEGFYNIKTVISHSPVLKPNRNNLRFEIAWEGYDDPIYNTTEYWSKNKSLHKNIVVLQYMLNNEKLKGLVPKNIDITN